MAKRRKNHKPQIKKWTSRHTNVVNALARFNVLTVENLRKVTLVNGKMMSENAFLDMVELGYFNIETIEYKNGFIQIATIGDKSIRKVRDIASETTKNIYNSSSITHDLEHSNFIFDMFEIEDIQKYYRSEKELANMELHEEIDRKLEGYDLEQLEYIQKQYKELKSLGIDIDNIDDLDEGYDLEQLEDIKKAKEEFEFFGLSLEDSIIYDLDIEEIRERAKREKELQEIDISVTDGAFIYDDYDRENVFIETATQHYTKEQREAHRNYANKYSGRFIENRIRTPRKSK